MAAGPGTWRIAREAVDAYLDANLREAQSLAERRRSRQLKALNDAWDRMSADQREQLCAELPSDLLKPLLKAVENSKSRPARGFGRHR